MNESRTGKIARISPNGIDITPGSRVVDIDPG